MPIEKVKTETSKVVSIERNEKEDYKGSKAYTVTFEDGSVGTNLAKDECKFKEGESMEYELFKVTSIKNPDWSKNTIKFPSEFKGGYSGSFKGKKFEDYAPKSCKNIAITMLSYVDTDITAEIVAATTKNLYAWCIEEDTNKENRLSAIDGAVRCLEIKSVKENLTNGKLSDNIKTFAKALLAEKIFEV